MSPREEAKAWQEFFFKSIAGASFMTFLEDMERIHLDKAQTVYDTHELAQSASYKEIRDKITGVIAQVADQPE